MPRRPSESTPYWVTQLKARRKNPPGWHAGEIETATVMVYDETLVDVEQAIDDRTHGPQYMGGRFSKKDGSGHPDINPRSPANIDTHRYIR